MSQAPTQFRSSIDYLHACVSAESGCRDFGPSDYLPGLQMVLESMDYDPQFSEAGRERAWSAVLEALRSRVFAVAAMSQYPEFRDQSVIAPVVITGLPRSGTTALHRLLAVDPRFQGLQSWLLYSPMPRPPRDTWPSHPEFQRAVAALEERYRLAPGKRAAHQVAAEEVHECCMLLRQSFVSNLWNYMWSAPTYDAWWQCQSEAPAYEFYRQCVQLIGLHEPGKRWLLKNPGHIEHLDLLFAVFPDARVIQTHRDPAKAIPSLVSLLIKSHPVYEDGRTDQRARIMLLREAAKWSNALAKTDVVRARHADQVIDVVHADFHRDPVAVLDRIYRFIGWDLPATTRAAMGERIEAKPELAHGPHRYSLADYGLSAEAIREPFGGYVERFNLLEANR